MDYLTQNISFDAGHIVLLVSLALLAIFIIFKCKASKPENLEVQRIYVKPCRCTTCADTCYERAKKGLLYGCDPNNPFTPFGGDECEFQYRRCMLDGCGIA